MVRKALLIATALLLLSGCGLSRPSVDVKYVRQVAFISTGPHMFFVAGTDNIEIRLDFRFDQSLVADIDPKSDEYKKEIFSILVAGAHLYYNDEKVDHVWGYWPEKAGSNYAKGMTLFYIVPSDRPAESLRFVYDGNMLGEGVTGIDEIIKPIPSLH